MLVAIEATRLLHEVRGIGRYVYALLRQFVEQRSTLHITLYAKPHDVEAAGRVDRRRSPAPRPDRRSSGQGDGTLGANVFWYPWNVAKPVPRRGAVVVTIHDIAPVALPDPRLRCWRKNLRWRLRYAAVARRATLIVADSRFTSDEIHRKLGVPYERMRVALLAADNRPLPAAEQDASASNGSASNYLRPQRWRATGARILWYWGGDGRVVANHST